jgi:hypothetical protein
VFEPGAAILGRRFGRVRLAAVAAVPAPPPDASAGAPESAPRPVPVSAPESAPADAPKRTVRPAPKRTRPAAPKTNPELHFAAALATGELPSVRRIRSELHVGQPKAQQIHAQLAAAMNGTAPAEQ